MSASKNILRSTRDFVDRLKANNELWIVEDEVNPNLELGQIQREVCKRKGPAILFTNVKGSKFPVATNLYGSENRINLAFGDAPTEFVEKAADFAMNALPPNLKKLWKARGLAQQFLKIGTHQKKSGPVKACKIKPPDLTIIPQIKSWPDDGGAFITLPLVHTESPSSGKSNIGMYRIQLFDQDTAGMHIQIHRGGGFHYFEAEQKNQPLPARIYVGGPPALTIAAIAPLPEDVPELLFASLLMGKKLKIDKKDPLGISLLLEADFSIQGLIPPLKRKAEGPFGDHYGYYSLQHDYPYLQVDSIYHRQDAIYPATIVGRPPQEDHYIAEYLQEILSPLFPMVMPNVKAVWAYEESGVHSLAGAIVKNRYHKEAFTAALRILSEGHLSLTKFLMITDQPCSLKDFKSLFLKVLERVDLSRDLFILSNISQDTLDYTGPKVNEGSKAILLGVGEKKNQLKDTWQGDFINSEFEYARLFCPGVLCVKGSAYDINTDLAKLLLEEPAIQEYLMVFLLDDANEACASSHDFIWHVFTRFEPAADIYGKQAVDRYHIKFQPPLIFDCRLKPWYPPVLTEKAEVAKTVEEKWGIEIDRICG